MDNIVYKGTWKDNEMNGKFFKKDLNKNIV